MGVCVAVLMPMTENTPFYPLKSCLKTFTAWRLRAARAVKGVLSFMLRRSDWSRAPGPQVLETHLKGARWVGGHPIAEKLGTPRRLPHGQRPARAFQGLEDDEDPNSDASVMTAPTSEPEREMPYGPFRPRCD